MIHFGIFPARVGRLTQGILIGLLVRASVESAELEQAWSQWNTDSPDVNLRSLSLIASQPKGGFGQVLACTGGEGAFPGPGFLAGGGRAGSGVSRGLALWIAASTSGPPTIHHTFEGPERVPGFGRILAWGPGPGKRPAWIVGRPDGPGASPRLECWQYATRQDWDRMASPEGVELSNLVLAQLPGDVTGDGRVDLVLAHAGSGDLKLSLYDGTGLGFRKQPSLVQSWSMSEMGETILVQAAGDVEGDGCHDLLVAFPNPPDRPGLVGLWSFDRSTRQLQRTQEWNGAQPKDLFGTSLLLADLTGDGTRDLALGAPGSDEWRGRVLVLRATQAGWSTEPAFVLEGTTAGDQFGSQLAMGRLRGIDRPPTLLVGAPGASNTHSNEGCIHAIPSEALSRWHSEGKVALRIHGAQSMAAVGSRFLVPGDLDGDGHDDVVIGIPAIGHRPNGAGRVDLLFGHPTWPDSGRMFPFYPKDPFVLAVERHAARSQGTTGSDNNPSTRISHATLWTTLAVVAVGALGMGAVRWRRRIEHLTREHERQRISRDLHDELGARLAALNSRGQEVPPDVSALTREVTSGIERTIWALHPDRRSIDDLACGLADLTEGILGDSPIRARFEFPATLPRTPLPHEWLQEVYRVAQEALTNVRKHSAATEVSVGIVENPEGWEIHVRDNGTGFTSPRPLDGRKGLGMANMQQRMEEIGGQLTIGNHRLGGAEVRIRLPRS
jgi:hypothetical protein